MSMQRKPARSATRRVAFVTGASTGIGAAIAVALAREGWDVAIAATRLKHLAGTARHLEATGVRTLAVALELRSPASVATAAAKVFKAFGRLDALVNNAGVTLRKSALEITVDEWGTVMQTNLRGTFLLSQAVGRRWVKQGAPGCIINMASAHGLVGFPNRLVYGVSKAGLIHMTRMLAIEWADHGIRVNAIAPATVDTPSRARAFADPKAKKIMTDRIPLHRFATTDEVAGAVCYLASPQAAYMTGQTLLLDGGLTSY
jgi:NAD(P)-dependent dehydrogenase (short-subunit alcohol dehydrogenase family)